MKVVERAEVPVIAIVAGLLLENVTGGRQIEDVEADVVVN